MIPAANRAVTVVAAVRAKWSLSPRLRLRLPQRRLRTLQPSLPHRLRRLLRPPRQLPLRHQRKKRSNKPLQARGSQAFVGWRSASIASTRNWVPSAIKREPNWPGLFRRVPAGFLRGDSRASCASMACCPGRSTQSWRYLAIIAIVGRNKVPSDKHPVTSLAFGRFPLRSPFTSRSARVCPFPAVRLATGLSG